MFELPITDGLTDDFAGGRHIRRCLQGSYLLARQGDTDLMNRICR
jgi:hypothetical protein